MGLTQSPCADDRWLRTVNELEIAIELTILDKVTWRLVGDWEVDFGIARHSPAISDKCHRLSAFLAQSQVKDERQVRPEIHMPVSPLVVKFDFEERCCSRSS
jgi:hypothetical protein